MTEPSSVRPRTLVLWSTSLVALLALAAWLGSAWGAQLDDSPGSTPAPPAPERSATDVGSQPTEAPIQVAGFRYLGRNPQGKHVFEHSGAPGHVGSGLRFVYLEPDDLLLGLQSTSHPQKERVTLSGFLIAETECTQAAWEKVMGSNPSKYEGPDRPVERVRWDDPERDDDVQGFLKRTGLGLPTEAQWEYACRAGTDTAYGFGDDAGQLFLYGNYSDKSNSKGWAPDLDHDDHFENTAPVKSYRPNAWGLFDMHGNVSEFCQDRGFHEVDGFRSGDGLVLRKESNDRVSRGGSWSNPAQLARSDARGLIDGPDVAFFDLGFRPAVTVPE